MTTSEFDSYRPPEEPRRRRQRDRQRPAEPEFTPAGSGTESYYGRPIIKAPPWDERVAAYLVCGGIAGGSALLALGADVTGRVVLRRNARIGALATAGAGTVALMADLGRPDRFLNMLRTVKVTSPMSLGSWLLAAFSTGAGVAAAAEVDRMTGGRLPLGPLRGMLRTLESPLGGVAAALGAPLAGYTAVLLSDTALPTWNDAKEDLPFVFVSSASIAASGLALITTPVRETGPARVLAVLGAAADVVSTRVMEARMDPVAVEPLQAGRPGALMRASERLAIAGGLGALIGGRHRVVAALSGAALLTASAFTRFGVFYAGKDSAKDPRYTVEPQKRRLAARRAAGITDDSITTVE